MFNILNFLLKYRYWRLCTNYSGYKASVDIIEQECRSEDYMGGIEKEADMLILTLLEGLSSDTLVLFHDKYFSTETRNGYFRNKNLTRYRWNNGYVTRYKLPSSWGHCQQTERPSTNTKPSELSPALTPCFMQQQTDKSTLQTHDGEEILSTLPDIQYSDLDRHSDHRGQVLDFLFLVIQVNI